MSEYEVGYKKPPKHSRFRKGQSGNRRGRPKGARNFNTGVLDMLNMRVPVKVGGVQKKMGPFDAALLILVGKALQGDLKAINQIISFAQVHFGNNNPPAFDLRQVTDEELDILEQAALIYKKYGWGV